LLAAGRDSRADVEQSARDAALLDDPDPALLLDDVEPRAAATRGGYVDGRIEARCDLREAVAAGSGGGRFFRVTAARRRDNGQGE